MSKKSEILHYIQEYKDRDSDYWTSGNGNNELLFILIKYTKTPGSIYRMIWKIGIWMRKKSWQMH